MKKIFIIYVLFLLMFFLSACDDLVSSAGDINDYVGTYSLDGASESTYHVSWGNEKLISQKNLFNKSFSLVISDDYKVKVIYSDGSEEEGKIKCFEKYCRFYNTPLKSSYQFYKRYDGSLYYSYESKHMSVEYDVTYIGIVFVKNKE